MLQTNFIVPIYNRKIVIIQGNKEEVQDWYWNKFRVTLDIADGFEAYSMSDQDGYYCCFEKDITLYCLYHEIGHIVFDICRDLGILTNSENAETFLYLQEYIMRESLKVFNSDDNILEQTFHLNNE